MTVNSFLSQEDVDSLLQGVTNEPYEQKACPTCGRLAHPGPLLPNFDALRKAYEAARLRHPLKWKPGSGMIDEVDGAFLALAFNSMHLLLDDLTPPKLSKHMMYNFHDEPPINELFLNPR